MQKFLFDLFPIILFFIAFKIYDIFIATAVAIIATLLQIIYVYLKDKKVEKVLLFNGVMITFLGGLTILLQDKMFIMWKPSVLYWCFALILLFSNLFLKKNLVQMALGKQVELKNKFWNVINWYTSIFFVLLGFINLYVAYNFSEDTWVNFKLFGITGLLFIYMIFLGLYISKVGKG
ncbi:MAG: septation protein A [Methylophilaceae bacterium]|jgi:intracellular septation protein|tara:strand:+ start:1198 stop:1728 length:531 start_codon:yes stop_codon:yes gene_type:complete